MEFLACGARNAKQGLRQIRSLRVLIATIKSKGPSTSLPFSSKTDVPGYEQWETWMAEAEQRSSRSSGSGNTSAANRILLNSNGSGPARSDPTGKDRYQVASVESAQDRHINVQNGAGQSNGRSVTMTGASQQQVWENGVAYASLLSWFDDFNMLGLGDFPTLMFPESQ